MPKRRTYLKASAAIASTSLAGCITSISGGSDGNRTLTSASILPESHPLARAGVTFREEVTKLTDGQIEWEHYPAGQLSGDPAAYINLVNEDSADFVTVATAYIESDSPLASAPDLPGTYQDVEVGTQALWHYAENFLQEETWDDLGIQLLSCGKTGPNQIIHAGEKIGKLSKWEGKSIRVASGMLSLIAEGMGSSPTTMASGDVYNAMERGTIDGALNDLYTIVSYGWGDVADYSTLNVNLGSGATLLGMDQEIYQGFSDDIKSAIDEATQKSLTQSAENIIAENKEARNADIEFFELPDSEVEKWHTELETVTENWIERQENNGHAGSEAVEAWQTALEKAGQ